MVLMYCAGMIWSVFVVECFSMCVSLSLSVSVSVFVYVSVFVMTAV
jgi:hypothetical protein